MTDHPLGDIGSSNGTATIDTSSLVDQVLDLNEFLAKDVRLALKSAAFYTRPDLESKIEDLNAELDSLTDSQGKPLAEIDVAMDASRPVQAVALELLAVQKEYAASRRVIQMQQLDEDDWAAFMEQWKEPLSKDPPYPPAMYADLIVKCAFKPRITLEELGQLRKKIGRPAYEEMWRVAWEVNTRSGVSIPKSYLSSVVLKQQQPG